MEGGNNSHGPDQISRSNWAENGEGSQPGALSAPGIIFQLTLKERFFRAESQDKQIVIDIRHLIFMRYKSIISLITDNNNISDSPAL
jgi:hypothetical protein